MSSRFGADLAEWRAGVMSKEVGSTNIGSAMKFGDPPGGIAGPTSPRNRSQGREGLNKRGSFEPQGQEA
eukprot:8230312-Pyramimonas_sp.AAC.1